MDTSLNIKSVEQSSGRKLQKTITVINPNADGTALKTWAQGLNNLTTNRYVGTTKINIDTLTEEDTSGCNPLPAPKLILGYFIQDQAHPNWIELPVKNYKASWSGTVRRGGFYLFAGTQGKINGISAPPSAMVGVGKLSDGKKWTKEPTDMIADMSPINRYILRCISPSYTDPDCLGKFVFQLDATDSHSSVTIVIDATAQIAV